MSEALAACATAQAAGNEKRHVALTSVVAAVVLTGSKLVVGLATGSLGILSEAAHSALDLVAAAITYFAVRVSDKPPDRNHRYGHGKVENLSALVETLLLLVTCIWIVREAILRLFFKEVPVEATAWSFAVIVGSIVIDVSRSRALMRVARKHNSQALEADALHFSTDVWSSAVVLLGLGCIRLAEVAGAPRWLVHGDAVAALFVAVIVIQVSARLGKRTIDALLDRAPTETARVVERAACGAGGVLECSRLRLRESGNLTFVDLVITVDRGLPFERSHAISVDVEERIQAALPHVDVLVHVEPGPASGGSPMERVREIAAGLGMAVHSVAGCEVNGATAVELHLEVDGDRPVGVAHGLARTLEAGIRAGVPAVSSVTIHIESAPSWDECGLDVTGQSAAVTETVRRHALETPGIVQCDEIVVRRSERGLSVVVGCGFGADLSVARAHGAATQLEQSLYNAIPDLARITTRAVPLALAPAGEPIIAAHPGQ